MQLIDLSSFVKNKDRCAVCTNIDKDQHRAHRYASRRTFLSAETRVSLVLRSGPAAWNWKLAWVDSCRPDRSKFTRTLSRWSGPEENIIRSSSSTCLLSGIVTGVEIARSIARDIERNRVMSGRWKNTTRLVLRAISVRNIRAHPCVFREITAELRDRVIQLAMLSRMQFARAKSDGENERESSEGLS